MIRQQWITGKHLGNPSRERRGMKPKRPSTRFKREGGDRITSLAWKIPPLAGRHTPSSNSLEGVSGKLTEWASNTQEFITLCMRMPAAIVPTNKTANESLDIHGSRLCAPERINYRSCTLIIPADGMRGRRVCRQCCRHKAVKLTRPWQPSTSTL